MNTPQTRSKKMSAKHLNGWKVAVGVSLVSALGGYGIGCVIDVPINCETAFVNCPVTSATTGGGMGGAGGNGGGGGMGGDGGGGGGMVGNCDPELGLVEDGCGVFASSSLGATGAVGSKEKPLDTLAAAIAAAGETKRVYACAEVFAEAVSVSEGVTIYGGLDCASDWRLLAEGKTTVSAAADEVALTVKSTAGGLVVKDVAFEAEDASLPGGSSVAVLVDGVGAEFVRCAMTAGDGAKGVDGADGPSVAPMQPGPGDSGVKACTNAEPILGAKQSTNDCGGVLSIGGKGGDGNNANGGDGANGLPVGALGQGGKGEINVGWSCGVGGTNGGANPGDNGMPGTPGVGATGPGTLSSNGYTGTSGTAGLPGAVGQGGGGGGGTKGGAAICMGGAGAGASGGAGGAGGCGGLPGDGAGPGGGSFALVSVNATVILTDCTLQSGVGGDGGAGGDSQAGGSGGVGGLGGAGSQTGGGSSDACSGGQGGKGGNGGPGGGGLGGPSVAVAHLGAPPEQAGATTLKFGTGGAGGLGGNGNAQNNAGADGVGQEVMGF